MNFSRRHVGLSLIASGLFVLATIVLNIFFANSRTLLQTLEPQSATAARVAALLAAYQGPLALAPVEKTFGCTVNGPLPDAACTPGAVFAEATSSQICVPGYTKQVRSVSTKLKKQIYAAYGIAYPQPTGSYELDHVIPLALGGSNDASNLFPEAKDPAPGFKEKDVVEVYLYEAMCAGKVSLRAAQAEMAHNWVEVYNAIDQSDITNIRAKYPSWSN